MLHIKDLSFAYVPGVPVFEDVNFSVQEGEFIAIGGRNGAGKTTITRLIMGLEKPTRGHIFYKEQEITTWTPSERGKFIGYVFQQPDRQMFRNTVEDEIAFGLFQLGCSREEVHAKTEKYIAMMGLKEVRKSAPFNLSGGEKKKTALAAVLAMNPEILILDEPAASLDEDGQAWLLNFLQQIKAEKKTLILATHQKELVDAIADQTIQMNKLHQLVK